MKNKKDFIREVLVEVYNLIGNNLPPESYAFKGVYTLMNEFGPNVRMTLDLDLSVSSVKVYQEIVDLITPLLFRYKNEGEIVDFKYKEPVVTELRNISGGVKLYREGIGDDGRKRRYKITDIDISIHPLDKGICINSDGFSQYTFERMLVDKISVLYTSERTLVRRIRDVYDIYCLYRAFREKLNLELILDLLSYRNVDIFKKSVFESFIEYNPDVIIAPLSDMLVSDARVDRSVGSQIKVEEVIETVLVFINLLRSVSHD